MTQHGNIEEIIDRLDSMSKRIITLESSVSKLQNENLELRKAYDAFTNPLFYLLDKDGILIAKKLSTNTLRKILIQSFRNFKN